MNNWDERKDLNLTIESFRVNQSNPVSKFFNGIEADLLELLVNRYEMSFEMVAPKDFLYGSAPINGSYVGKLGLLQRDEADILIGLITGNSERASLGKYSPMIYMTKFALCSRNPPPINNWEAPLRPFPILGWAILGVSILLVAPVPWFITKKHRELMNITNVKDENLYMFFGHVSSFRLF